MRTADVCVVIPARNEASTVAEVVQRVRRRARAVLVVDDASEDGTAARARSAGAQVLTLSRPGGCSGAIRAGCAEALESGCTTVVTMDADGAHDPEDLPGLLDVHHGGAFDLTVGDRFGPLSVASVPSPKRCANGFAAKLVNAVAGTRLHDVACGFRAMGRAVAQAVVADDSTGYALLYRMIISAAGSGRRIAAASVGVHYDAGRLLCTPRPEILDLLRACRTRGRPLDAMLEALAAEVHALRPVTVRIEGAAFCWHPLAALDGYVMQLQDPAYAGRGVGRLVDMTRAADDLAAGG